MNFNKCLKLIVCTLIFLVSFELFAISINFNQSNRVIDNRVDITNEMNSHGSMTTLFVNDLSLNGAKFLPFLGNTQFHYPEDVRWGFYPKNIDNKAIVCAEIAYNHLLKKVASKWPKLHELVDLGVTNSFFLWVNDFSHAAPGRVVRFNGFWLWSATHSNEGGFWVWEATLTQDSQCLYPNDEAVDRAVERILERYKS